MSDYRLNTFVYVAELDSAGKPTGRAANFGPDDSLPDWAVASISNPDVWDGEAPPTPEKPTTAAAGSDPSDEVQRLKARIAELEAAQTGGGGQPAIPSRRGPGSGAPEWREYARGLGVTVADDASRDDAIAAVEAAGYPTK